MVLSDFGKIAYSEWVNLPLRFEKVMLHEFQIMPNHIHGIIELTKKTYLNFIQNPPSLSDSTMNNSHPFKFTREGASPVPTKSVFDNSKSNVREEQAPPAIITCLPYHGLMIMLFLSMVRKSCTKLYVIL